MGARFKAPGSPRRRNLAPLGLTALFLMANPGLKRPGLSNLAPLGLPRETPQLRRCSFAFSSRPEGVEGQKIRGGGAEFWSKMVV
jgi:hypothetical protein